NKPTIDAAIAEFVRRSCMPPMTQEEKVALFVQYLEAQKKRRETEENVTEATKSKVSLASLIINLVGLLT
ncbi:MAG: hypothetical protein LUG50_11050, partial [Planctomycetaceae bacterium]|nr:hypothetical protein [Planctomycetaceae bacterium]